MRSSPQMMQALVINLGTGFLAYGKKSPFFQRAASRWCRRRLFLTRSLLLIGWPPVVYFMVQNYYRIERVLDGEAVEGVELDPFPAWFPQLWSRDGNNECMFCWYCIGPLSCSDSLSAVARSFSLSLSISAPSHANGSRQPRGILEPHYHSSGLGFPRFFRRRCDQDCRHIPLSISPGLLLNLVQAMPEAELLSGVLHELKMV